MEQHQAAGLARMPLCGELTVADAQHVFGFFSDPEVMQFYDCEPLTLPETEALLGQAGFVFQNQCIEAMRATIDIEQAPWITARAIDLLPDWVVRRLLVVFPTLIYRFGPIRLDAEPTS